MAWRSTRRFSRTRRKILIFTQVPQFAIAHCSECVFRAGATPDVTVARDLEVLAYHMLYTKPWIGRKYAVAPALRDCVPLIPISHGISPCVYSRQYTTLPTG